MTLADAVWLGIVQGLTEFLPVSSDGHLALAHALLGASSEADLLFDLMLHLGTLVAVCTVFGRDIVAFVRDGVQGLTRIPELGIAGAFAASEGLRMGLLIVIASVPTAIIGLLLKESVESRAFGITVTGLFLMLNGVTLWCSRYARERTEADTKPLYIDGIGPKQAALVGIAQGLAVLPGISRSGSTIVSTLLLGGARTRAAQFSFLMAVPAIAGAALLQLSSTDLTDALQHPAPYIVGTVVSAAVGIAALRLLLDLLRAARFHHFAWYCWAIGLFAIFVGLSGEARQARESVRESSNLAGESGRTTARNAGETIAR
jgi:undecaprenyl-diphosphatase